MVDCLALVFAKNKPRTSSVSVSNLGMELRPSNLLNTSPSLYQLSYVAASLLTATKQTT